MKKYLLLFLTPLLGLACLLALLLMPDGVAAVAILLGDAMVLPVMHFALVGRYLRGGEDSKRRSAALTAVSIAALVAMSVLTALVSKGLTAFWFLAEMAWTALCGVVILTHTVVGERYGHTTAFKIAVALEAVAVLAVCALLTETLGSRLAVEYSIDGIELLFWPLCWLLLALYSYILGRTITGKSALPTQLVWLCGVAASVFTALYLEGSPRTLPTAHVLTTVIWIVATAVIFIPGVIAARRARRG